MPTFPSEQLEGLFGPHPRVQIDDLPAPPKPNEFRSIPHMRSKRARELIHSVAMKVYDFEADVGIWKNIYRRVYAELLPDRLEALLPVCIIRVEQNVDPELHLYEELLYITAIRIFFLHDDLKDGLARGLFDLDAQLTHDYTADQMKRELFFLWDILRSPDVLSTIDLAVRKEKLLALKAQHNKDIFLNLPAFAHAYDEAHVTSSIRNALDSCSFEESQLTDIHGLDDDYVQHFRPFALAATLARNNTEAMLSCRRRGSYEADSNMSTYSDLPDDDDDDPYLHTWPDHVDIPGDNVAAPSSDNSTDPFAPISVHSPTPSDEGYDNAGPFGHAPSHDSDHSDGSDDTFGPLTDTELALSNNRALSHHSDDTDNFDEVVGFLNAPSHDSNDNAGPSAPVTANDSAPSNDRAQVFAVNGFTAAKGVEAVTNWLKSADDALAAPSTPYFQQPPPLPPRTRKNSPTPIDTRAANTLLVTGTVRPAVTPLTPVRPAKRARPSPPASEEPVHAISNYEDDIGYDADDDKDYDSTMDYEYANDGEHYVEDDHQKEQADDDYENPRLRGGANMTPVPSPPSFGPRITHPRVTAMQHEFDQEYNADSMASHRNRAMRLLLGEETTSDMEELLYEQQDISPKMVRGWKRYCSHP